MKDIKLFFIAVTILFSSTWTAWGHDYWILPESFHPDGNGVIDAAFTSSHTPFQLEEVPDLTKYRVFMLTPQHREVPLACSTVQPEAARFSVPLSGPGTYVIGAASIASEYWCQTKDGWKTGPKSQHSNAVKSGKYVKSVKSFLTVDKPTDAYKMALGHTIELIPQKNPCSLVKGQELPVMVLYKGRPLSDVPVFGIYEGYKAKDHADLPVKTKTTKQGIAEVKVDRPGKWLVYAKYEVDTPDSPHADYENYRPYMMFQVR